MINYKYPNPSLIPVEAEELDYLRYVKRSTVSDVEASHILCGVLPKIDSALIFLNPRLEKVHEVYKLLVDAAKNGNIENIKIENGSFRAPLINWGQYLIYIDHPIPDDVLIVLDRELKLMKKLAKSGVKRGLEKDPIPVVPTQIQKKQKSKNQEKLIEELKRADKIFPTIPYKYFFHHPDIIKLAKNENLTEDDFANFAADAVPRPRPPGRPRKDMLDDYEKAHLGNEMQEWFRKIKALMEISPKN